MHCIHVQSPGKVYVWVCRGGSLWRGKPPLSSLSFVQSLGDSHHQKSMCVRAYVRLCVCQGFVRQISPACAALVLLNQASITRPLWIMQGRLLLTYSTGCSHWCVLRVHACVTGWFFFLLANATGQFFDVPPLGPLNLVSDTGTPTLILVFWSACSKMCARVCALEASSVDGKSLTWADSPGLHFDTPWLITYSPRTVEYCH